MFLAQKKLPFSGVSSREQFVSRLAKSKQNPNICRVVVSGRCHNFLLSTIGVLVGCFGEKIDGDSWFTWWFNHLPGKPIYLP